MMSGHNVCLLLLVQVAAFAMGRGPLAMSHCTWTQNLLQFGVVLSLPVIPKDGEEHDSCAAPSCSGRGVMYANICLTVLCSTQLQR
jgi:hypothetical protein